MIKIIKLCLRNLDIKHICLNIFCLRQKFLIPYAQAGQCF